MASIAFGHIMDSAQQTGLRVALGSYATRCGGDIVGVWRIMDDADSVIGMAIQTACLEAIGDHIGYGSGLITVVKVDGLCRIVAAGAGAFGLFVVQFKDVGHFGQVGQRVRRPMTEVTLGSGCFLCQVGGPDGHAMGDIAAGSAVDVAIKIGRMTV